MNRTISRLPLIALFKHHLCKIKRSFSPVDTVFMSSNVRNGPTITRLAKCFELHVREVFLIFVIFPCFKFLFSKGRNDIVIILSHFHSDSVEMIRAIARESNTSNLNRVITDNSVIHFHINLAFTGRGPIVMKVVRSSPTVGTLTSKRTIQIG